MHEILVKRTIFVARCEKCGDSVEKAEDPPKERFCGTCGVWVPYEAVSYTGPSLSGTAPTTKR